MSSRLSLAQQIAELDSAAPVDFDPENAENGHEDSDTDNAAAREHYVDVGPSTLRQRHDTVLDPKYGAVRISRKKLVEEDEDNDLDEGVNLSEYDRDSEHGNDLERGHAAESHESGDQEEGDDDEESQASEEEERENSRVSSHEDDDLSSTLKRNREQDLRKGVAVSQQLATWNSLLDARIRLQKSVNAANRLPTTEHEPTNSDDRESLGLMLREAMTLSEELFDLQETMLSSSCDLLPRKKRRVEDADSRAEYETYFSEATRHASAVENSYHPSMIQTLDKWSSKIQAVAPSVLLQSNRNTFSKGSQNLKSAVQLIDESLKDQNKLVQRTQIWRGKGPRLEDRMVPDDEEDRDTEIFDDTDFYQQLLRDIIDAKNGANGPDDWIVAQKQRKAKKKVDTKASKGRKIRYDVHEKLQNFMVPIGVQGAWHEQQIDELFGSILGLGLENALGNEPVADNAMDTQDVVQGGFRVFG